MSSYADEAAFASLYEAEAWRVYAYARRHTDPELAHDVVSDTFLAAWRHRDSLPTPALPWLLVTARNCVSNHWRSRTRQDRLATHLAGIEHLASRSDTDIAERLALTRAFAQLSLDDRETLLLVGWDGLTPAEAAEVLGCSANTYAVRLSRARRRFTQLIDGAAPRLRLVALPSGELS